MALKKKANKEIPQAQCVWGLICSLSSIDQQRNNISLFEIVEQFNIPTDFFREAKEKEGKLIFPVVYEIVLLWKRTLSISVHDEAFVTEFKINLIDPTGTIIEENLVPLQFRQGAQRTRFRIRRDGIPLTVPGDYAFLVETKRGGQNEVFDKVNEIPLEVRKVSNPQGFKSKGT